MQLSLSKKLSSSSNMCSEKSDVCDAVSVTPRHPALSEFKDALFSLVHLCQTGSLASSSAPSPRDESNFSRSQSIVSEDFSCLPPEEPEWLSKMSARAFSRAVSGHSRPASRRDSGLSGAGRVAGAGGAAVPSPLRHSLSVATSLASDDVAAGAAPSPRALDTARQTLFDRFGSFEGLTAALEDFYQRLCNDERIGSTVKQVPQQDVWLIMTQLMAVSLHQQQQEELLQTRRSKDREQWVRRCQELLRPVRARTGAGAAGGAGVGPAAASAREQHPQQQQQQQGEGGGEAEGSGEDEGMAAVYDAVMDNLLGTLERLGALGPEGEDGLGEEMADGGGGDGVSPPACLASPQVPRAAPAGGLGVPGPAPPSRVMSEVERVR